MLEDEDDYPTVKCPHCGNEESDMDGFGFVACLDCGYCKHPSWDQRQPNGLWHCCICGAVRPEPL